MYNKANYKMGGGLGGVPGVMGNGTAASRSAGSDGQRPQRRYGDYKYDSILLSSATSVPPASRTSLLAET